MRIPLGLRRLGEGPREGAEASEVSSVPGTVKSLTYPGTDWTLVSMQWAHPDLWNPPHPLAAGTTGQHTFLSPREVS